MEVKSVVAAVNWFHEFLVRLAELPVLIRQIRQGLAICIDCSGQWGSILVSDQRGNVRCHSASFVTGSSIEQVLRTSRTLWALRYR